MLFRSWRLNSPKLPGLETVWLNRNQLSELYEHDIKTIGKHIHNALKEELSGQNTVVADYFAGELAGAGWIFRRGQNHREMPAGATYHHKNEVRKDSGE